MAEMCKIMIVSFYNGCFLEMNFVFFHLYDTDIVISLSFLYFIVEYLLFSGFSLDLTDYKRLNISWLMTFTDMSLLIVYFLLQSTDNRYALHLAIGRVWPKGFFSLVLLII
jgi:hypothetical protein